MPKGENAAPDAVQFRVVVRDGTVRVEPQHLADLGRPAFGGHFPGVGSLWASLGPQRLAPWLVPISPLLR
jgi:hypothetical protein